MHLKAMVANSVFNDIVGDLTAKELQHVSRRNGFTDVENMLSVTAEVTPDKLLEIAKATCAGIDMGKYAILTEIDLVSLEAHDKVATYGFETLNGMLSVWLPLGERL